MKALLIATLFLVSFVSYAETCGKIDSIVFGKDYWEELGSFNLKGSKKVFYIHKKGFSNAILTAKSAGFTVCLTTSFNGEIVSKILIKD